MEWFYQCIINLFCQCSLTVFINSTENPNYFILAMISDIGYWYEFSTHMPIYKKYL